MKRSLAAALYVTTSVSYGQATPAPESPAPPITQIKVSGSADTRRTDTAGRISVSRDDISRFGDTNLSSALRRQPGISVQNGEVRMRGLGAGYTQILINGEPTPAGFSIDSIAPALIDRIDILRGGSAELSSQGIAGTINVILRKAGGTPRKDLTLASNLEPGRASPSASLRVSDKRGMLAWSVAADAGVSHPSVRETSLETVTGKDAAQRESREHNDGSNTRLGLAPRLTWTFDDQNAVSWNTLLDRSRNRFGGRTDETTLVGEPTEYPESSFRIRSSVHSERSDVTWTRRSDAGATLLVKAGIDRNYRENDYQFRGQGKDRTLVRDVVSNVIDNSNTLSGKYLTPLGASHSLGMGWDSARIRRTEQRLQRDTSFEGVELGGIDEDYDARVTRLALFAQDEWSVTPRLQVYLGLRWEGLRTHTEGRTLPAVSHATSVWSPIGQMLWKLPDTERDQIRVSLSRSYKAPATRLLVPRRYTTNNNNNPTLPDVRGNPNLLPELAWGLDGAYEHYFSRGGMVSLSAYARHVSNVTVQSLTRENGKYISEPVNAGSAKVWGLEADSRIPLSPALDLRANVARNWSRLAAVPGPDNRVADQLTATFNGGIDYKRGPAHTMGANFNVQYGGPVRTSERLRQYAGVVRQLDVFSVWTVNEATKLRLAATNVLNRDQIRESIYVGDEQTVARTTAAASRTQVRLVLERRL